MGSVNMTSLKPIKIYSAPGGPNPIKVTILCDELNLPYDFEVVGISKLHQPPFTDVNPNGRTPAIEDPNTGLTVWESGAIFEYLIETYDKDRRLSHDASPEKWQEKQWLFLQVSGQGPYWGQAAWFNIYHHEQLPSAQERYMNEVCRLAKVIDTHLASRKYTSAPHPVLVGDKLTYADLIFLIWNEQLPTIFGKFPGKWNIDDYPAYKQWIDGMKQLPSVQKGLKLQQEIIGQLSAGQHQ